MKINIVETMPFNSKTENVFPSLRCAIEWAKNNKMKELNLIKIIIKQPNSQ